jgi:O-antigen/teichoic acid export membrane protein
VTDSERIVANTAYRATAEVVSKLVSVAFYVVLAREVGAASFGVFTFGLAIGALVTTLASFGQDAVVTREVARRRDLVHHYFLNTIALKLALGVPVVVATVAIGSAFGMDSVTRQVVLLLGIAVTVEALMAVCFSVFQGFDRLGFIPVVLIVQRVVMTGVGIPIVLLGGGVVAASAVYLGGALAGFGLGLYFIFRRIVRPRLELEPAAWTRIMRTAAPIGIGTVFMTTLFRIDAALLALFTTSVDVGQYGAAYRLFEASLFLTWAVGAATYPVFARLGPDSVPSLREVHDRALKLTIAPTLPIAVGALVLGPGVTKLFFGEEYERGGEALTLMAGAVALFPVAFVVAGMLVAQDRQGAVAKTQGLVAAQNIAANVALIPLFGLSAAALNASVSEAILAGILLTLAWRQAGGIDVRRVAAGPVLAGFLCGITMLALHEDFGTAALAGGAVYIVVLGLWERLFYPDDARAIADFILRRRRQPPSGDPAEVLPPS